MQFICSVIKLDHQVNNCHILKVTLQVPDLPIAADGSENVTGLDLTDFPALADRSRREGTGNPTPVLNPLAGRAPYGRPLGPRSNILFLH